jgi:hypothetical protein
MQTGLGSGASYTPDFGQLNAPDLNIHTSDPGSYYNPAPSTSGGANWQNGYGGGYSQSGGGGYSGGGTMTPSTVPLNPGPGYTPPDWSSYLNAPDLTIKTSNGSNGGGNNAGHSTGSTGGSTFSGNSSGGTLGGGYAVDPSQWGALGLGGDSGPVNGGIGQGYALQLMSGGMHEGGMGGFGGGNVPTFLGAKRAANGNPGIVPPNLQTGGAMTPQSTFQTAAAGWLNALAGRPIRPGGGLPPTQGGHG